jgi:hypothetical protein
MSSSPDTFHFLNRWQPTQRRWWRNVFGGEGWVFYSFSCSPSISVSSSMSICRMVFLSSYFGPFWIASRYSFVATPSILWGSLFVTSALCLKPRWFSMTVWGRLFLHRLIRVQGLIRIDSRTGSGFELKEKGLREYIAIANRIRPARQSSNPHFVFIPSLSRCNCPSFLNIYCLFFPLCSPPHHHPSFLNYFLWISDINVCMHARIYELQAFYCSWEVRADKETLNALFHLYMEWIKNCVFLVWNEVVNYYSDKEHYEIMIRIRIVFRLSFIFIGVCGLSDESCRFQLSSYSDIIEDLVPDLRLCL